MRTYYDKKGNVLRLKEQRNTNTDQSRQRRKNLKRTGLYMGLFLLIGFLIPVGFSFVGTWDSQGEGFMETQEVNATTYYLNGVNLTARLSGDYSGFYLVADSINTGQGANDLYDMDQNVLIASNVNFSSVEADEFYLNSVNKTDIFAYPQQDYSYLVWVDSGTYYAKNGVTGDIQTNANIATLTQDIINSLSGTEKGVITFRNGVFNFTAPIDPSQAPNYLTIQGIGKSTRIYVGNSNSWIDTSAGGSFLELKDFYLRAPAASTSTLVKIDQPYGHVSILNVEMDNINGFSGTGFSFSNNPYEIIINQCSFNFASDLVFVSPAAEVWITENKFSYGDVDIRSPYAVISNNGFEFSELEITDISNGWWLVHDNWWSNQTGRCIDVSNSRNGIIHDNVIRDCVTDGAISQPIRLAWAATENVTLHDNIIQSTDVTTIAIREQDSGANFIHHNNLVNVVGTKFGGLNPATITRENLGYLELGDLQTIGGNIQMYNGTAWITIGP